MPKKSKTQDGSDVSRSPSKSPTPRRASSDDQHSPLSNDDIDDREKMGRLEEEAEDFVDQLQHDVRDIRDIRDDLPPYLPSVMAGPKRQRQLLQPVSRAFTAVPTAVVINTLARQLRLSQRFQHHNLKISIKYRFLTHFRAALIFLILQVSVHCLKFFLCYA